MELPELLRKQAEKQLFHFCFMAKEDELRPRHLRYQIEGLQIELFEVRRREEDPHQHQSLPMAQIRFSPDLNQWTLHYLDNERWKLYLSITPSLDLARILSAIQQDPMGYFWQE